MTPAEQTQQAIAALGRGGQKLLARELRKSIRAVRNWQKGDSKPTHAELEKINEIAAHPERFREHHV